MDACSPISEPRQVHLLVTAAATMIVGQKWKRIGGMIQRPVLSGGGMGPIATVLALG